MTAELKRAPAASGQALPARVVEKVERAMDIAVGPAYGVHAATAAAHRRQQATALLIAAIADAIEEARREGYDAATAYILSESRDHGDDGRIEP